MKNRGRWCQFRTGVHLWECFCGEEDAKAALNFVRFMD